MSRWNISAPVPHLWVFFWAMGNRRYKWISTILILLGSFTACTYMEQCCSQVKNVYFSESYLPSSCSPGTFTSIFCYGFRIRVVTIPPKSSLFVSRKRLIIVMFSILGFFSPNLKYLKNKSRDNTFKVMCIPGLKSPHFNNLFLSFSLLKTVRQMRR